MNRQTRVWLGLGLGLILVLIAIPDPALSFALPGPTEAREIHSPTGSDSISLSAQALIQPHPDTFIPVIMRLKGEPVVSFKSRLLARSSTWGKTQSEQVRAYADILRRHQEQFAAGLEAEGIVLQVHHNYTLLLNALAAAVKVYDVARLATSPTVQAVDLDHELHVRLPESVPLIGADQVWHMLDPSQQPAKQRGSGRSRQGSISPISFASWTRMATPCSRHRYPGPSP